MSATGSSELCAKGGYEAQGSRGADMGHEYAFDGSREGPLNALLRPLRKKPGSRLRVDSRHPFRQHGLLLFRLSLDSPVTWRQRLAPYFQP